MFVNIEVSLLPRGRPAARATRVYTTDYFMMSSTFFRCPSGGGDRAIFLRRRLVERARRRNLRRGARTQSAFAAGARPRRLSEEGRGGGTGPGGPGEPARARFAPVSFRGEI